MSTPTQRSTDPREARRQREAADLRIAKEIVSFALQYEAGFWGIAQRFPDVTLRQFCLAVELASK